jgi:flagellar hook-associated protein 1
MLGLKNTLWNSVSGMSTSQAGLSTVGHNIANADTEGYSRQTLQIGSRGPLRIFTGSEQPSQAGQGSQVINITRSHSTFLERQLLRDRLNRGFHEGRRESMQVFESIFDNGASATVGDSIDTFFNSARELSQDPSSPSARRMLVEHAEQVARDFNSAATGAREIQQDIDRTISNRLEKINELARVIAEANARIGNVEATGQSANDFRDHRDQAIKEIAELADVRVFKQESGLVSVDLANGFALVRDQISSTLRALPNPNNDGLSAVQHVSVGGTVSDITGDISFGEIGGLLDLRDNIIPAHMAELDTLAFNLSEEVNAIHRAGFGLDGVDGRNFFTPIVGGQGAAAAIQVEANIVTDPGQIAAATDAAAVPGDNRNIDAITDLQTGKLAALGNTTFGQFFGELTRSAGYAVENNSNFAEVHTARYEQSDALRESIEGVSLDDEMVDLSRYQKHFEASARVMSTVNRLMDEILQLVR